MTEKIKNLWKLKTDTPLETPKKFIEEQASILSSMTKGRVRATVRSGPGSFGDTINHKFFIHAPYLGDYSYNLFEVEHHITLSPINILCDLLNINKEVRDTEEFQQIIAEILGHEKTSQIVNGFMAQSQ